MSNFFDLIKQGESKLKVRKTPPIPVPEKWYKEMANEYARDLMVTATRPAMQLARINAVEKSGADHEVMSNGMIVPINQLCTFYQNALEEYKKLPEKALKRAEFKQKYIPVKGLKGNLTGAKAEILAKKLKQPKLTDNNYNLLHRVSAKYFLCDREMTLLMDYMVKLGIIN